MEDIDGHSERVQENDSIGSSSRVGGGGQET